MDRPTLTDLGAELRTRREARGITRAGLAGAVGSRPVIIGRWERGEAVPAPDQAQALARVLELPPGEAAAWVAAAQAAAQSVGGPVPGAPAVAPRRRPAARWREALSRLSLRGAGVAPGGRHPDPAGRSYLDDPDEQKRYAVRWALTLAVLAALGIALIWALGELADGWRAVLELFRSRPGTGQPAGIPGLLTWL